MLENLITDDNVTLGNKYSLLPTNSKNIMGRIPEQQGRHNEKKKKEETDNSTSEAHYEERVSGKFKTDTSY